MGINVKDIAKVARGLLLKLRRTSQDPIELATLARALVHPVTGQVAAYINANGELNLVKTASAGQAFISLGGSDDTGEIGSPDTPFATMQAAYDAGATVFILGVGTFAGLTLSADSALWVLGYGAWDVIDVIHPKTIITEIDCGPHQLYLWDIHGFSCQIESIVATGAAGANGAASVAGGAGGDASLIGLRRCVVSSLTSTGGAGGNGGTGNTNGGAGGDAGPLDIEHCYLPLVAAIGGAGGTKQGSGTAGTGGNGSSVVIKKQSSLAIISNKGGAPGAGGTGGDGGSISFTNCEVAGDGSISTAGGAGGGNDGTVTAIFSIIPTPDDTATTTVVGSVVAGAFEAS